MVWCTTMDRRLICLRSRNIEFNFPQQRRLYVSGYWEPAAEERESAARGPRRSGSLRKEKEELVKRTRAPRSSPRSNKTPIERDYVLALRGWNWFSSDSDRSGFPEEVFPEFYQLGGDLKPNGRVYTSGNTRSGRRRTSGLPREKQSPCQIYANICILPFKSHGRGIDANANISFPRLASFRDQHMRSAAAPPPWDTPSFIRCFMPLAGDGGREREQIWNTSWSSRLKFAAIWIRIFPKQKFCRIKSYFSCI